jgi:hypothetical protein
VNDDRAIWCLATQGTDSGDERRIRTLLEPLNAHVCSFERAAKRRSGWRLFRALLRRKPSLVVMEGTGIAGGVALMAARVLGGVPYVISSGDAVGPYVRLVSPLLAPLAALYERALCRFCSGFIGWSPYLTGRALTFGAPRAMTAPHWALPARPGDRTSLRAQLGIPEKAIVFGIVGSVEWSPVTDYCYGLELIRAIRGVERRDVRVLVVGDGSGLERLRGEAGSELGERVLLAGRVSSEEVASYLAAMDVASLPQSVDGVGSFRYTTKISEYLAGGLPVVTGQIPLAYDLDEGWIWRLPGDAPWESRYVEALRGLMEEVSLEEVDRKRSHVPRASSLFDRERQQRQVAGFIRDLLGRARQSETLEEASGSSTPA